MSKNTWEPFYMLWHEATGYRAEVFRCSDGTWGFQIYEQTMLRNQGGFFFEKNSLLIHDSVQEKVTYATAEDAQAAAEVALTGDDL